MFAAYVWHNIYSNDDKSFTKDTAEKDQQNQNIRDWKPTTQGLFVILSVFPRAIVRDLNTPQGVVGLKSKVRQTIDNRNKCDIHGNMETRT